MTLGNGDFWHSCQRLRDEDHLIESMLSTIIERS